MHKNSLIQGFEYVWQGKQEFNLKNVLDFIDNELSVDSFKSTDDKCKQWFIELNLLQHLQLNFHHL
jgi:hypothetical protein